YFEENQIPLLNEKAKASKLLLRPGVGIKKLIETSVGLKTALEDVNELALEQAEIQVKYDTYIQKEQEIVKKMLNLEDHLIPQSFNYEKIQALSIEARQKLT